MNFSLNLKINNISHSFNNKYFLFKNLDYEIESSEMVAITGPNGSGKSTLIKIIASLLKPSNGNIELFVNQNKIKNEDFYLYTSLVSPYLNLYEEFTGLEHIKICEELLNKNSYSERSDTSLQTTCTIATTKSNEKSPLPPFFKGGINIQNTFSTYIETNKSKLINDDINTNPFPPFSKGGRGDFFSFLHWNRMKKKDKTVNHTIKDLLDIFELKKIANYSIKTYSSGQKQRLKYVLALLKEPLVCLFDEPFTNLDDNGINIAKQYIDNMINKKCIVIIASNDNREIELSNRKIELI